MTGIPRVIISAERGRSGKTLFTTLLLRDLIQRGVSVSPFKVGPDFIDPMHHSAACGVPSRNLDEFLMGMDGVKCRLHRYSDGVAVIEGVMGLYDSIDGVGDVGSTAKVARETGTPVILVLNGDRINRGLAAVLRGFREFGEGVWVAGVALTNVTERQAEKVEKAVAGEGVPLVGVVPRSGEAERDFRYRHLGLVTTVEGGGGFGYHHWIDVDAIIKIAESAPPLEAPPKCDEGGVEGSGARVGVIIDEAFSFYYPETLEELRSAAGSVSYINSMKSGGLGSVDALIIGGGFPEEHADAISRNKPLLSDIRRFSEEGGFIYAECGGLMLLSSVVETLSNEEYDMSGAIDAYAAMLSRPVGHGYVEAEVIADTPMFNRGRVVRGHEFHHSRLILREPVDFYLRLRRGSGIDGFDGVRKRNTYAQYTHMHPYGVHAVGAALAKLAGRENR